jgi:succinate-acetate transporter protein
MRIIFTGYMTVAATALSRPVLTVFVLLTITYLMLAIGSFASQAGLTVLGRYLGITTALAVWYASAKGIWAATFASRREA